MMMRIGVVCALIMVAMAGAAQPPYGPIETATPMPITVDQPAYAGEPIWVHAPAGKYFIRYPFSDSVQDIGCNRVELRYEGEAVDPRKVLDKSATAGGIQCGSAAPNRSPQNRLPLHVLFPILKPGHYSVRWVIETPNFDRPDINSILKDAADSGWISFTVSRPTEAGREDWLKRLLTNAPTDPGMVAGEYIPSLVAGAPDARALDALANQLYSTNHLVGSLASSALHFFPQAGVRDEIFHQFKERGPSEELANIFSLNEFGVNSDERRLEVVRECFKYLKSEDARQEAAAIKTLQFIVHFPENRFPTDPSLVETADRKVMDAAPAIIAANKEGSANQLAIYLGQLKSDRAHELLAQIAHSEGPAAEQAQIAVLWHAEPDDLARIGALMFQPGKTDYGRELSHIPYALMRAYGDRAIPILRRAMADSPYIFVRTAAAEELARKSDPAAFAFFLDEIVHDRWPKNSAHQPELIQFLKDAFPSELPRTADREAVVRFLRARSAVK